MATARTGAYAISSAPMTPTTCSGSTRTFALRGQPLFPRRTLGAAPARVAAPGEERAMADNRKTVEQFIQAMATRDWEAQDRLLTDDFVEEYPQSGERIVGKENRRAIIENYPGGEPRETSASGPSPKPPVIVGAGDQFTATGQVKYPNGETW